MILMQVLWPASPTAVAAQLRARREAGHQRAMAHIIVAIIVLVEGYFIIIAIRETYKYL